MRGLHIFLQTAIPYRVPVHTTSGSELLHGDLHELVEAGILLQLLGDLKGVQCPFIKDDIEFWFGQLEGQLEVIEIKSQWLKRIAVQRFLPSEIQEEVKGLLSLGKTAAGEDIYLRIKKELIELFGRKPEDSYTQAKNRVLSGKPSQLGKAIINDICKKDKKLNGCCCADTTWGMIRDKLPIVVRNHLAEMPLQTRTRRS